MDKIQDIKRRCIDVIAHSDLDYEYTVLGNGILACESGEFAWEILGILEVSDEEAESLIEKRVNHIEKFYNDGDVKYWE